MYQKVQICPNLLVGLELKGDKGTAYVIGWRSKGIYAS